MLEKDKLSKSFNDSLLTPIATDFAEIGLDSLMSEGILKDIPFVSTAVSLYNIGKTIHERHHIKKMAIFIQEINRKIIDEKSLDDYKAKFAGSEKFRNQELEYLIVIIERYIGYYKPIMLARLYFAYLEGTIDWQKFLVYSEVIDKLLMSDYKSFLSKEYTVIDNNIFVDIPMRLMALGLVRETTNKSLSEYVGNGTFAVTTTTMERAKSNSRTFDITEFGKVLIDILD